MSYFRVARTFRRHSMNKLILAAAFVLVASWPCYAQERNERPMYGGMPPSSREARADQEFIEGVVKQFGSREKAAKVASQLGFQNLAKGDWKTAMKRFNQAWLLTGESAEVFWGFASTLSYQGKFGEAEKYFLKAKELDPNNGRLLADFGFMYQFWSTKGTRYQDESLRYLDKSIELFERASRLEPTYDRTYFNWAVSLFFKQDYEGAWGKIKEAERLGGRSIDQKFIRDLTKKMPRPLNSERGVRREGSLGLRLRATLTKANSGRSGYAGLAFSPDGRILATGDEIRPAKLWDVETGQLRYILTGHNDSIRVVFSPDGLRLATSGDKKVTLWNVGKGELKFTLTGSTGLLSGFTYWLAFSPDGHLLLASGSDSKARLYETATGQLTATFECRRGWMFAVFSPDGRTIATACNEDKTPKLWDVASGHLIATLTGHDAGVPYISFSPDGRTMATESLDDTVNLWTAETGELKATLAGHRSTIYQTQFSSNGRFLATASRDGTAILWDVAAGSLKHRFSGFDGIALRVSLSPDSRLLAASGGYRNHEVKVWEVQTGRLIATMAGHRNDIEQIVFSPDGRLVVTGSKESARAWNALTGELVAVLNGGRYPVVFSPDGRTLATAGQDASVLLWQVAP